MPESEVTDRTHRKYYTWTFLILVKWLRTHCCDQESLTPKRSQGAELRVLLGSLLTPSPRILSGLSSVDTEP